MNIWKALEQFNDKFNFITRKSPELPHTLPSHVNGYIAKASFALQCLAATLYEEKEERALRIALLVEEVSEYLDAERQNDLVGVADALTDIHYIAAGTELQYGIPAEKVFKEVHVNNMSKVGEDGNPIYNEEGKLQKPEGFKPPNIRKVLFG